MRPAYQYTTYPYLRIAWGETPNGQSPDITYEWKSFKDWERTTSGVRTPDYWSRHKSKNRLPINPYTFTETRRGAILYGSKRTHNVDGHTLGGMYTSSMEVFAAYSPFYFFGDPSIAVEANNKAVLKFNERLSSIKVNYAQFFAERKQTAKMFEDTAFRIVRAASSLKRGDLTGFMRSLSLSARDRKRVARGWSNVIKTPVSKRIANHWLEYQYGWKPLLSDIYGSAELLARQAVSPRKPHGSIKVKIPISKTSTVYGPRSGLPHFVFDYQSSLHMSVTVQADYVLDDEASSVLAETGISNPLALAWELLPFSFVVDWFIPVGTYLGNLTAQDGFKLSACCTTTFKRCKTTMNMANWDGPDAPTWYTALPTLGSAFQNDVSMVRSPTFPSYALQAKNPLGGAPAQRMATALSLLRQLFR